MSDALGEASCPICGGAAELKQAKTTRLYIACDNGCSQCFSRSRSGDRHMRERFLKAAAQPKPAPAQPAAPAPAPRKSRVTLFD